MKIHILLEDGSSKVVDVDVSTLSEEQLNIYAEMGAKEAIKELKNRIGFNPYKAIEDYTLKDAKKYQEFLESKSSKKEEESSNE
jgi:hypothetical protein